MTEPMPEPIAHRRAGTSDLHLSTVGIGCWSFGGGDYWGPTAQRDVDAVVHRAVERGVNYFDTAEAYYNGASEEALGRALRGVDRDRVVIGSKVSPSNIYPDTLVEHFEASLRRLETDYLDLYMVHWPVHEAVENYIPDDREMPTYEAAAEAMRGLQEDGRLRYVGASNSGARWLDALEAGGVRVAANQLPYSLMARAVEYDLLEVCAARGIGVVSYMALMQGLLADRFETIDDVPDYQRRSRHFAQANSPMARHNEPGAEPETAEALAEVRRIADDLGWPMAQVAIRWVLEHPAVTCALVGVRGVDRLEENLEAAATPLPADAKAALDEATRPLKEALGPVVDLWEHAENDRTR